MKIPQYGAQQTQTGFTRSAKASKVKTAAGGTESLIATGLRAAADVTSFIADDMSTTEAESTLVKFERESNKLLHAPDGGYLNTQGKDAFEMGTDATERLQKMKDTYGSSMSGAARSKFNTAADSIVTRGMGAINKHSANGYRGWKVSTIKDGIENSIENIGLNWDNDDEVAINLEVGRAAVRDAAKLEGVDSKERLQNFDAAVAATAIESATADSADSGKTALKKYGDMLEGSQKNKMKEKIETKSRQEEQRDQAIQSVTIANNMLGQYENLTDMQTDIRKKYASDPELMGKALKETQVQYRMQKVATQDEQAGTFNDAQDFVRSGGSVSGFMAINPQGWDQLSAVQKASLDKQELGTNVKTNWNLYNKWSLMQPNELAKVNPNDYQPHMAPAELKSFNTAFRSARRGEKTPEHQVGRTRASQTTNAMVQLLGANKKDWSRSQMKKVDAAYDMLNDMVVSRETQFGRKLTPSEYTDTLSDLTYKIVKEQPWYFGGDEEVGLVDDILGLSNEDRMVLTNRLRNDNLPVTAENMMRLYDQVRTD